MADDRANREVVERYWRALERSEFDAAVEELADDFVETYPQSGETIRGKDNFLQVLKYFPSFPAIRVHRHVGCGDVWITEAAFDYSKDGSQPWEICDVQELRDGKIVRIRAVFGAPFDAAEWRAKWVERS
ncbi:MAG: nuclear transport factor 2 family protein [Actinomycetota bacterium]|nr:nuclear transport factor 2 family protein [Actinomycetota bacterium]